MSERSSSECSQQAIDALNRSEVTVGTRKSKLALWQTAAAIAELSKRFPQVKFQTRQFTTKGDRTLDQPLPEIGGKGLFTAELDKAICDGEIDLAIHSLKDLPTTSPAGISIAPVLDREDARDVLVSRSNLKLHELPADAIIGTSSPRRQMQIMNLRPDVQCRPIRGNVPTRIRKVRDGEYDATVLAAAGVNRLGLQAEVAQWFELDEILPAPGQAMMAATFRSDDALILELVNALSSRQDNDCVAAERTVLSLLGGGCAAPIAACASVDADRQMTLTARIGLLDGKSSLIDSACGSDGIELARQLTEKLTRSGAELFINQDLQHSLKDKRIVVSRAPEQCEEFAALLRATGAVPIVMPSIEFRSVVTEETTEQLRSALQTADWIIFTSRNAIRFFFAALEDAPPIRAETRIACVGSRSAASLSEWRLTPDFVPRRFSGDTFAAEFAEYIAADSAPPHSPKILYPSAVKIATDLPKSLEAHGCQVNRIPVYETLEPSLSESSLDELRAGVDVVTFASPSAARSFSRQVKAAGLGPDLLKTSCVACIGEMTAQIAQECEVAVDIVPEQSTLASLVLAIIKKYKNK